jgi:hypothetical protein
MLFYNDIFSPEMVCHYTKFETAKIILSNKALRFNPLSKCDDPRESKLWEFSFIGQNQLECIRHHNDIPDKFSKYVNKYSNLICFCGWNNLDIDFRGEAIPSFREDFYRVGWAKPRMWSQYGENHKGVCFVFEKKSLENDFDKLFQKKLSFKGLVDYKYSPWSFITSRKIDCMDFIVNGMEKTLKMQIGKHYRNYYFIKHMDYLDEIEYRLVVISKNEEFLPISSSLKGMVIGVDFPETDYNRIQELVVKFDPNIETGFLSWQSGQPVFWNLWELTKKRWNNVSKKWEYLTQPRRS